MGYRKRIKENLNEIVELVNSSGVFNDEMVVPSSFG